MKYSFIFLLWAGMIITWLTIMAIATQSYYQIYSSYPEVNVCEQSGDSLTSKEVSVISPLHTPNEIRVRSVFASLNLFTFSIDSNAIDGWLEQSDTKDTTPSDRLHLAAILAGAWTIFFFVILFARVFQLWFRRVVRSMLPHKDLYIFWGVNQRSIQLAKELSKKNILNDILFIVEPTEMQNDISKGLGQIISRSRLRHELQKNINSFHASVLIAEEPLINFEKIHFGTWISMGLGTMWGYVMLTFGKIHVMLLGEDETKNIYDALKFSQTKLWCSKRIYDRLTIHCHARRSNVNRTIEDLSELNKIKVIDSSYLSIELLKQNVENHPIQFVKLSETNIGTVETPFRSLIVGFSECGQDALRFLYEFSAFVDKGNKDFEDDVRSPFYCDIVDKERDVSAARLFNHAKGVFEKNYTNGEKKITFHEINYTSKKFYENVLKQIIDELNYVVIAIGNDREGITLAVDILRYAIKSGRDKKDIPFRIYVRSYEPNMTDFLYKIARFYNDAMGNVVIQIFGDEKKIYTKAMLIDDTLDQQAKTYEKKYNDAHNIITLHNLLKKEKLKKDELKWIGNIAKQQSINIDSELSETEKIKFEDTKRKAELIQKDKDNEKKQENPLSTRLNELRNYSQNVSNALHFYTKEFIKNHYDKEQKQVPLVRLAQTEHLRWVAAHEIMGYRPDPPQKEGKDILHYKHACMIPWRELLDNSREYDFLTFHQLYTPTELLDAIQIAKANAPKQ